MTKNTTCSENRIRLLEKELEDWKERHDAQMDMMSMTTSYMKQIQDELSESKNRLLEANLQLQNSINSAERIQQALLPSSSTLAQFFPQSRMLFLPRDTVSGDILWISESKNEDAVLMAVIDCTGHGVPGAMLTVLTVSLLDQIVKEEQYHSPKEIIKRLDQDVYAFTHNAAHERIISDGMDIVLIKYLYREQKLIYSGAHRPLTLVRNGQCTKFKTHRYSIGENNNERREKIKNHELTLQDKDIIHLYSDGFADQFGGAENKKFMSKRFRKLLVEISEKSIHEQHKILSQTFNDWKRGHEQTDDVIVVSILFSLST